MVRRYAISRSLLDIPNERSSHQIATPRGGGLAISAVILGGVLLLLGLGALDRATAYALLGGFGISCIGWLDDRGHVPAIWRASVHLLAALWALYWLGGLPSVHLGAFEWSLQGFGVPIAALGIVWMTNLYNFMDGIDGIAAGEALVVGSFGVCLLMFQAAPGLATVCALIAGSSAGFLVWNWAPAKIFMGDVGSSLLGFLFGVLAVASENSRAIPLLLWILLLGAFTVDATATLLRRFVRGERWYAAHRSHAYQKAVLAGLRHAQVTSAVLGITTTLGLLAAAAIWTPNAAPFIATFGILALIAVYEWTQKVTTARLALKLNGTPERTKERV
jgi:Fuc2NAc and GlcNAc transferase